MAAVAGDVAHPFFAVTGPDGSFNSDGLPPGNYTIDAWHEVFGRVTERVTVGRRQTATVSFAFSLAPPVAGLTPPSLR
jgi:hypothetical protein